ncbi:MAG: SAM hydrolase/SAM-dependent halogenase family protein [Planctomycetota bacterium]
MIILLTDFSQSEYVGVMKGVICRINNNAKIIDLCHNISPQSIIEASWILKNNYRYFTAGGIFCCVVDPGVGTERKALAVKTDDYYFIAPDNGLLWETLQQQKIIDIRTIPVPQDASNTFHGRDVFAKAAANIDIGNYDTLGQKTEGLKKLQLYQDGNKGMVVRIDSFGNIITNLSNKGKAEYSVLTQQRNYRMNFYRNYESAKDNELFLIEGSCNTLEISLKNDNANNKLHLESGTRIEIS